MPEKKKILLLVSGMSPQIITETLYALITQAQPWVPDEVHLITTQQGRSNAIGQLLNEKTRIFEQLLSDYAVVQPVLFDQNTIHIIEHSGKQLEDLRTPDENQAAADCISEKIRQFTQDENIELHVSLAGGRKTMGFYAGYALSLFGRAQDKLSHVLVSDRYESSDFYYPAPIPDTHWIKARDGSTLDTHRAQVWLAEIPFVRMRDGLPSKLLTGSSCFSETIKLARYATEQPQLVLNPKTLTAKMHGQEVKLSPANIAMLLWVRQRGEVKTLHADILDEENMRYAQDFIAIANQHGIDLRSNSQDKLEKGMTKEFMEQTVSRLNTALKKAFGDALAKHCKLASKKMNKRRAYTLPSDLKIIIE